MKLHQMEIGKIYEIDGDGWIWTNINEFQFSHQVGKFMLLSKHQSHSPHWRFFILSCRGIEELTSYDVEANFRECT
jgi:hypothetical protein